MSKLFPARKTYLHTVKLFSILIVLSTLSCIVLVPKTLAHSPLGSGDNESLDKATFIPDPMKSWAIYAELHEGGEAQYYRFDIKTGQRIHVMLFKSTNPEDEDFLPGFVLMGPGIDTIGVVPDFVEVPSDSNTLVKLGSQPSDATYEPFSPSTFYSLADLDIEGPSSGTYYVAVYEPFRGGHYGLAIGDIESYTLTEWILIPLNLLSVYQWEGQSLIFILAPLVAVLAIGIILLILLRKNKTPKALSSWFGFLAGLLFLGTSAILIVQMVLSLTQASLVSEIVITIILALIPVLLGFATLRLSLKTEGKMSPRTRIYFAILGVVALFSWAGLLIGPALAIIASLLPSRSTVGKS